MESGRAIIMGASSGMGFRIAELLLEKGWKLGVAARREELLQPLKNTFPNQVITARIDVNDVEADKQLLQLTEQMGGIDLYLHVSGIGKQNMELQPEIELGTVETNGLGFTRCITAIYNYMAMRHLNIRITDIRPGFVATPLLGEQPNYPMLMDTNAAASEIVRYVLRKSHVHVLDWRYRILTFFWSLCPRCLWRRLPIR